VINLYVYANLCFDFVTVDLAEPFKSSMLILVKQIVYDLLEPKEMFGEQLTTSRLKEKMTAMETTFVTPRIDRPHTLAYVRKSDS